MANRYPVTATTTLAPGKMRCFDVNGKRIILINVAGEFFATDEMCSHEEFPLWYGALRGHFVECSLHGSCFDVRTGQPTEEPATQPIKTYATEVEGDTVYVVMD
ncbi:MAG: Rieske 2Fe-2S domain-containing protein [Gammaproteobacteria bacterium]|nr:Rieske 2Fe-2S domain-containing protein [Gammaproteobacteria bacterium]